VAGSKRKTTIRFIGPAVDVTSSPFLTHAESRRTRRKENLRELDEITGAIVDPSVKRNLPVGRLINNLLSPLRVSA
jgi:hypothetical protein